MSPSDPALTDKARSVKDAHLHWLMQRANVVGVGVGYRWRQGMRTDTVAIVVMVKKKVPASQLDPSDVLPHELDGIPLDIQEVGDIGIL